MARDPDQGGAFVFDLVDDGADDSGALSAGSGAGSGGGAPGPGEPAEDEGAPADRSAARERYLRVMGPVAAVLAVVLGTGLAVEGVRDGARMERMREAPGGVVDVSRPLDETWLWEGPVGRPQGDADGRWSEVAALGGLVVFQSEDELVALEPGSGEEAWTVPLGADPDCGPLSEVGWGDVVTRNLVCLAGAEPDRTVVLVNPDGSVSAERALDPAETERYGVPRPGPAGTVLRVERVGPAAPEAMGDAVCNEMGECTGTVEDGRDLALRAEDAVTGAERWSATVAFRTTPADQCANWSGRSWDGTPSTGMLDADDFGAQVWAGLVLLYGCGVHSAVTPEGAVLDTGMALGTGSVERLRTGAYAAYTYEGDARTDLLDADGDKAGELEGYALQAMAVAGPEPETLMGSAGSRLWSYTLDATPRWDVRAGEGVQRFLAQVGDTAVVLGTPGVVRGLDLATGAERWSWDGAEPGGNASAGLFVSQVFTDGRSVLLAVENGYGGRGLAALDAATGEVVWEQPAEVSDRSAGSWTGFVAGLLAVDGHLVEVTPEGVRGLG